MHFTGGDCHFYWGEWWLRSPGVSKENGFQNVYVSVVVEGNNENVYVNKVGQVGHQKYGVRPALQLDLSSVIFSSINLSGGSNATASGGGTIQNYFDYGSTRSAMTAVSYTANDGYYFPENYSVSPVNGISVTRNDYTTITVSGTPTESMTSITLPAPTAKTEPTVTAPTANDLTYTGSAQELVTAGAATGGTMYYALGATSDIIPEAGWSTDIPTATDVGTYYVWYKVEGDATHTNRVAEPLTATIKNKPSPSPSPTPSYSYYTVKFEMNGHGDQVSSQTVRSGLKAKEPSDPSEEGYTFAGWYGDSDCTKPYDFSTPVTKNTTLYAKWDEIRYTVSFDLDGKGTIAPQSVKQGETAKKPTDPSAEGYTFVGWYVDDIPYVFSTPVTKDITIYAKWEKVVPPVLVHRLYNPNSGEHFYTISDDEKDGLVTAGWNHEANAGFSVPATAASLPVYRLYNPNGNEHIYTTNLDEAVTLSQVHGWIYEGVAFYTADPTKDIPVYRVYNPNSGHHLFTKDKSEVDVLVSLGWIYEGIAWYAVPDSV